MIGIMKGARILEDEEAAVKAQSVPLAKRGG